MTISKYRLATLSTIILTGANTQTFLQGQLTCDMDQLNQAGDYSLAACCDHKGRMIANFWVLRKNNDVVLILPTNMRDIVITHLQKYAVFSKVVLTPNNDFSITAIENTEQKDLKNQNNKNTFAITLPNPNRHLIITAYVEASETDDQQWLKNNIQDQFCLLTPETSLLFTPQMINLEKQGGVSFEKGCYVGQEIVARTQHLGKLKRHLHHIQMPADTCPDAGDSLMNDQQIKVGVIVSAISSTENTIDALAVIEDRQLETVGKYVC